MNGDAAHHGVVVLARLGKSGEAAASRDEVLLSDDHGTVLVYTRDEFALVVAGWQRLLAREMGGLTPASA